MVDVPFSAPNMSVQRVRYSPRGAAFSIMLCRAPEAVLDGPAGTGKTLGGLWKMHLAAIKYPGMHGLLLRKTLVSLKSSTLVTFRERVLGERTPVRYWASRGDEAAHYAYPNGSKVYVGGLDNPGKIMSTEYDLVFPDEATDLDPEDWEAITTRLRRGVMPYQQLYGAVNPQQPTHWLNQRMDQGRAERLLSHHEDNPRLWDAQRHEWTSEGERYLGVLDALTGARLLRLRYGIWAAAEGMVYQDTWDRRRNIIDRSTICARGSDLYGDCGVPRQWARYLSVDFGYTHPFVMQWWAEDHDGRFYRYREIYRSNRLVEDHARDALKVMGYELVNGRPKAKSERSDPLPYAIYCDHDQEDRFTLERHMGLLTQPAYKAVSDGIQAVAARLRPAGDERPRLMLLRDSLVEHDAALAEAKQPTCTEDEIEGYVWNLGGGRAKGEEPVKEHDHGADAMRYLVATRDRVPSGVSYGPKLF